MKLYDEDIVMSMCKNIFVFDLDGTLANHDHRLHLIPTENLDISDSWLEFVNACDKDVPIKSTISVLNSLYNDPDNYIIILTARSEAVKNKTVDWLCNNNCEYDNLFMRGIGDNSKDTDFKERVLREIGLDKIVAVWEDNPHVIKHMRGMGLTVYQVCETDTSENRLDLQNNGQEK